MAAKKMTGGKTPPKRTDTKGRSGMGATAKKMPKGVSQTASTRIPGGALDATKIGVYKTNRETGRQDLVGSASRTKSATGVKAAYVEKKFGRKIDKVVIQDKPYLVTYVSSAKKNKAKTTPKGKR